MDQRQHMAVGGELAVTGGNLLLAPSDGQELDNVADQAIGSAITPQDEVVSLHVVLRDLVISLDAYVASK